MKKIILGLFIGAIIVMAFILVQESDFKDVRVIKLYYYSPSLDLDNSGNIMCSKKGLVAVEREIPVSETPIKDSVELLLRGELSADEKELDITTEYPLAGFELKEANLRGDNLILEFSDPQNKTNGGSCRVSVLWSQIEQTVLQFPEVSSVTFMPEDLFQP